MQIVVFKNGEEYSIDENADPTLSVIVEKTIEYIEVTLEPIKDDLHNHKVIIDILHTNENEFICKIYIDDGPSSLVNKIYDLLNGTPLTTTITTSVEHQEHHKLPTSKNLTLKKLVVGNAYKDNDHYFLQRENDVLHLNVDKKILNVLDVDYLIYKTELVDIDKEEFVLAVKKFIYEFELDSFWNKM